VKPCEWGFLCAGKCCSRSDRQANNSNGSRHRCRMVHSPLCPTPHYCHHGCKLWHWVCRCRQTGGCGTSCVLDLQNHGQGRASMLCSEGTVRASDPNCLACLRAMQCWFSMTFTSHLLSSSSWSKCSCAQAPASPVERFHLLHMISADTSLCLCKRTFWKVRCGAHASRRAQASAVLAVDGRIRKRSACIVTSQFVVDAGSVWVSQGHGEST
jgi:hypothetical protein